MDRRHQSGRSGETLARRFLEHHHYRCIASNYRRRVGELDLIMQAPRTHGTHDQTIVFTEVRYRSTRRYGGALASINRQKQKKLILTANAWLQAHAQSDQSARIDVIAIEPSRQKPTEPDKIVISDTTNHIYQWQGFEIHWIINAIST